MNIKPAVFDSKQIKPNEFHFSNQKLCVFTAVTENTVTTLLPITTHHLLVVPSGGDAHKSGRSHGSAYGTDQLGAGILFLHWVPVGVVFVAFVE